MKLSSALLCVVSVALLARPGHGAVIISQIVSTDSAMAVEIKNVGMSDVRMNAWRLWGQYNVVFGDFVLAPQQTTLICRVPLQGMAIQGICSGGYVYTIDDVPGAGPDGVLYLSNDNGQIQDVFGSTNVPKVAGAGWMMDCGTSGHLFHTVVRYPSATTGFASELAWQEAHEADSLGFQVLPQYMYRTVTGDYVDVRDFSGLLTCCAGLQVGVEGCDSACAVALPTPATACCTASAPDSACSAAAADDGNVCTADLCVSSEGGSTATCELVNTLTTVAPPPDVCYTYSLPCTSRGGFTKVLKAPPPDDACMTYANAPCILPGGWVGTKTNPYCTACAGDEDCEDYDLCTADTCKSGVCDFPAIVGCPRCKLPSDCQAKACNKRFCNAGQCVYCPNKDGTACGSGGTKQCTNGRCLAPIL